MVLAGGWGLKGIGRNIHPRSLHGAWAFAQNGGWAVRARRQIEIGGDRDRERRDRDGNTEVRDGEREPQLGSSDG